MTKEDAKLPHENRVPTLAGRTNTGERYVSLRSPATPGKRAPYSRPVYHVSVGTSPHFSGEHTDRRRQFFNATPEGFAAAIIYRDAVLEGDGASTVTLERAPSPSRSDFDDLNDPQAGEWFSPGGVRKRIARQAEMRVWANTTGKFGPGDELAPFGKSRKELLGDIVTAYFNGGKHVFVDVGMETKEHVKLLADQLHIEIIVRQKEEA